MSTGCAEIILSAVVAVATVLYTCINWKMLKEARINRENQIRPGIIPYLKSAEDHQTLNLFIKNIGQGAAYHVKGFLVEEIECLSKKDLKLSDFGLFTNGIDVFPSQHEIHYLLDWWDNIRKGNQKQILQIYFTFQDSKGKEYQSNIFKLHLLSIASIYQNPPETYSGKIAYFLNKIDKNLEKIKRI